MSFLRNATSSSSAPAAHRQSQLPTAAVIICCYTEQRWRDLLQAIESVRGQTVAPQRLVVVVDHNERLREALASRYTHMTVVANRYRQGLSGARNTGVAECAEEVVAFLDDDATADPDWLETLLGEYLAGDTIAAGGHIEPAWDGDPPPWFPAEFGWVVGCSYHGQPTQRAVVRNVIGANMSFRRSAVQAVGGFGEQLGRIGASAAGCEETELCLRTARHTGGTVVYQPRARVRHHVPADRASFRYFRKRCFAEGRSKAAVARMAGAADALRTERGYVTRSLSQGVQQALRESIVGHPREPLQRAAVIVFGLLITASGYGWGRLSRR
jgi:GT2 family glycosyltransferase